MSKRNPAYYKVYLTELQIQSAKEQLETRGYARLHIDVEIVELGQDMQALSWVWAKNGSAEGNLRQCRLTPAQWAECMLILESGNRPVYRICWDILGQLDDGCWGVAGGTITSLDQVPSGSWGELNQLTGLQA
jgi:hypothetical protein